MAPGNVKQNDAAKGIGCSKTEKVDFVSYLPLKVNQPRPLLGVRHGLMTEMFGTVKPPLRRIPRTFGYWHLAATAAPFQFWNLPIPTI